ncbi:MAG: NAD(P)(+) transhydrogenase (Re/Si-specific) subunit beta, partial [Clostridiales bacterium]|nr:NAD(P)(+) transhydrogenase (Re/Si-specific) subunit beta [Clostridiales bacterium]
MTDTVYLIVSVILTIGVLIGISLLSRVKTAVYGNMLSVLCTAGAIIVTMYKYGILSLVELWISMIAGLVVGLIWAYRIKMIQMPQVVAFLNGLGGAAAASIAIVTLLDIYTLDFFALLTAALALTIGMVTLTGSMVAAGKLHKLLPQKPINWRYHQGITTISLILVIISIVLICIPTVSLPISAIFCLLISGFFGIAFTVRVGGADMPITISLLVSFSGIADGIAGMAINNLLLVILGGTVGASGLLLTKIMCRAMNRQLSDILMGRTAVVEIKDKKQGTKEEKVARDEPVKDNLEDILKNAKRVIIVPGYGMALAQAQQHVKQLADKLEANGAKVDFAIHPVAGRMPGHMNVLLAEADVPYEKLKVMEEIDHEFEESDLAIVIGANDVINPAANTEEGTPIYGMPILNVEKAKHIIICNYDLQPGYSGVDNPLY